jgi:hypothetical protein
MKLITPVTLDPDDLTTNVTNEHSDWSAGTYNADDRAVYNNQVYEALSTTTDQPDTGAAAEPATWLLLGYSNQLRMFTEGADSVTSELGDITVAISDVLLMTDVYLLGCLGVTAQVVLTDSVEGIVYDETIDLTDIGCVDWWEYFFLDYDQVTTAYFPGIPPYPGSVLDIVITAATETDPAECGRVIYGVVKEIGITVEGVESRVEDYSTKERDGFGNLKLVPRRTIRIVDFPFMVENAFLHPAQRIFQNLAAIPTLYVGDDDLPETIVFGVFLTFIIVSDGFSITECSTSIEEF